MNSTQHGSAPTVGKLYRHRSMHQSMRTRPFELYRSQGSIVSCVEGECVLVLSAECEALNTRTKVSILRPDGTIGRSSFFMDQTGWSGWWEEVQP